MGCVSINRFPYGEHSGCLPLPSTATCACKRTLCTDVCSSVGRMLRRGAPEYRGWAFTILHLQFKRNIFLFTLEGASPSSRRSGWWSSVTIQRCSDHRAPSRLLHQPERWNDVYVLHLWGFSLCHGDPTLREKQTPTCLLFPHSTRSDVFFPLS